MAFLLHLVILVSLAMILAVSLHWVLVLAGRLSLAHAAFYGLGAYTVALATLELSLHLLPALLLAMLVPGLAALLLGMAVMRRRADIFAFVTLLVHVAVQELLHHTVPVTGGPFGISDIPRPGLPLLDAPLPWGSLLLVLVTLAWVVYLARKLERSPLGEALREIRSDRTAAHLVGGINANTQTFLFVVSALVAGIAGGLFATYLSYIEPEMFAFHQALFLVAVVLVGGARTTGGALGGALALVLVREAVRLTPIAPATGLHLFGMLLGLLLIFIALLRARDPRFALPPRH